jgi:hypothetical protein
VDDIAAALLGPADPVLDTVLGRSVRNCPPYGGPHGTRVPGPVRLQTQPPA